jgi:hypothetical protein
MFHPITKIIDFMKRRQFIQSSLVTASSTIAIQNLGLAKSAQLSQQSQASKPPRKLALLVGINDYSKGGPLQVSDLKGCINDVALLKNLLIYRYGFAPQDIVTLTNAQATRQSILHNIETHLLSASSDDTIVFSFSGHGAPLADRYDDRPDARTTGILPYDHSNNSKTGETNYITGTTLFLLRSAFKTQNVTLILDCCYSGGSSRSLGNSRVRAVQRNIDEAEFRSNDAEFEYQKQWRNQLQWSPAQLNQNRQTQTGPKGVLLSASQSEQTAQDTSFGSGFNAGAFTKFLTDALWEQPEQSLESIKTIVQESLIAIAPYADYAQRPVFTYPANQSQLSTKSCFFTAAQLPKVPVQGMVLATDRAKRQIKLWLGGLSPRHLEMETGTEFRLLTSADRSNAPIATLIQKVEPDFTALATIPDNNALPAPGTLLQQYYRPIAQDLQLNLGLNKSLGITDLSLRSRIKAIALPSSGQLDNIDLVFSQMTSEYQQLHSKYLDPVNLPKVGSYGLFSSQSAVVLNSFGKPGETLDEAKLRLMPKIKVQLIRKLFGAIALTNQEIADRMPRLEARIHLKASPATIISIPNQIKQSVKVEETIEVYFRSNSRDPLEALLIGIAPSGTVFHRHYPSGDFAKSFRLNLKDGLGNTGEFMILLSDKSLDTIDRQLKDLIQELQPPNDRPVKIRSLTNAIDDIFTEITASSSRSDRHMSKFVLSLPLHIVSN